MKRAVATCLLLGALCNPAARAAPPTDDPQAAAEIGEVVRAFQAAIIAKDRAALEAMFLPSDNSWLTVASPAVKVPEGKPRVRPGSYKQFAEFVGNSKQAVEERFYNVRIHTNGSVGAVYFDFDFLVDGKVTNKGSETWHLVRTDSGWKISSMVYSIG